MTVRFRSRIDPKLAVAGIAAPCVAAVAVGTTAHRGSGVPLAVAIVSAVVAAMVVWIVLATYYEITDELLVAHSGPFAWRIPLKSICRVRASRSVRSGPALSMERLEITWGAGQVLRISPRDSAGFDERSAAPLTGHPPESIRRDTVRTRHDCGRCLPGRGDGGRSLTQARACRR